VTFEVQYLAGQRFEVLGLFELFELEKNKGFFKNHFLLQKLFQSKII